MHHGDTRKYGLKIQRHPQRGMSPEKTRPPKLWWWKRQRCLESIRKRIGEFLDDDFSTKSLVRRDAYLGPDVVRKSLLRGLVEVRGFAAFEYPACVSNAGSGLVRLAGSLKGLLGFLGLPGLLGLSTDVARLRCSHRLSIMVFICSFG
jgi:hypothetical protein